MKKILLLLTTVILAGFSTVAQNYTVQVSGYVYSVSNNFIEPVPGQSVDIIIDSTNTGWTYFNTVITNENGYYEDVVTPPGDVGYGYVQTRTFDTCLGLYQYNGQFFAPGATMAGMDFYLCGTVTTCQAMFYYYSSPADPYAFNFVNISTGNFTGVLWDFGDGITSTDDNPVHIYAGPGIYTVCLTITGPDDCNSTYCETVYVGNNGWGCENYFNWFPTDSTGTTIQFEGYLMNGQQALSYDWDFGDGTTGSGQSVSHTYTVPPNGNAIFMVSLTTTVPDSNGTTCTFTSWQEVWLYQPGCESYIMPYNQYGLTVEFQGWTMSQYPTEYNWEFGDGITATGEFVTHTYATPGIYMVSLYTIDETGCEWQSYMEVWVDSSWVFCDNYFYYEQTDSTTFTFTGQAYLNNGTTSDDVVYTWDFGDGTTGTGQTVTHYFQPNPAGVYTVCLNTIMMLPDGDSCFAVSCQDIWLVQPAFSIFGHIYLENNQVADYAEVHLMTLDTLWQNVYEVETVLIDSGGFYSFDAVPMYNSRMYYVQAELTEASAFFGDYLPTYSISALNWESANPILPFMNWPADVYMIPGTTLNSGNGTITGTVNNLGTRGMMEDVEVVLMDAQMNPYKYLRSDEQGNFQFGNLPMGTYIIHAEIMGIHTNQATVTLSEGQPEVSVEIQVTGTEANVVFGMNEHIVLIGEVGDIYPNPVTDNSRIDLSLTEPARVEFSVFNQLGQLVAVKAESLSSGPQTVQIGTGGLKPGLYLLRITTADGDLVTRRFVNN